eukprot:scaffold22.g6044.t1
MGHSFIQQGCYQQAARCFLAAVRGGGMPAEEAQARLSLARLLLEHFDNLVEAKTHLLRAELVLRPLTGQHALLKCEVFEALAQCHQLLGAEGQQAEAIAAGLRFVQQEVEVAPHSDRRLVRYSVYWQFQLARHALAVLLLGRAQLHLHESGVGAANKCLEAVAPVLEGMAPGPAAQQLRAHYLLLYVSMAMATGRVMDLQQGQQAGNFALLEELHQLLAELQQEPWAHAWVPPAAAAAVAHLLHGALLRSVGKVTNAAVQIGRAEEAVDAQLQACGMDLQSGEGRLAARAVWQGQLYAHLKLLVLEQRAVMAMQGSAFQQAGEVLETMVRILRAFPTLLRDAKPPLHLLLAHYAACLGDHAASRTHFEHVRASEAAHLHRQASLGVALSWLMEGDAAQAQATAGGGAGGAGAAPAGGVAGVARAREALEEAGVQDLKSLHGLPAHERCVAQLVLGAIDLRRGDDAAARVAVTKALKQSHTIVTAALNALAPIQAGKGDAAGAMQMYNSARTLSKTVGDLASLVAMLRGEARVKREAGDVEAAKTAAYLARKEGELVARVDAARHGEGGSATAAALLAFA